VREAAALGPNARELRQLQMAISRFMKGGRIAPIPSGCERDVQEDRSGCRYILIGAA
jgi:hypothetical protein